MYAVTGAPVGDIRVHPFVTATQIVQPSAISHWSAMHHHGLTEQIPLGISAITPKKVVTFSMRKPSEEDHQGHHAWNIGGIQYEYITVKPEHFFGIAEVWIDENFKVPITDKERTVLDLFAGPRLFGGMGESLAVLEEHLHEIDLRLLVDYAVRYATGSVAKRLGWSLEQAGVADEITTPLADIPTSGFRILDPTRPHRGPCDKRWGIQNNLGQEVLQ
jgi:predicted transcriptional regulator of viral defense system